MNPTGYGPRHRLPEFDGEEGHYELWEVKFLDYMRLQKLYDVIIKKDGEMAEQAPNADKLADAFAELVQCLDDKSLSLIIRDAKDDGRKAEVFSEIIIWVKESHELYRSTLN